MILFCSIINGSNNDIIFRLAQPVWSSVVTVSKETSLINHSLACKYPNPIKYVFSLTLIELISQKWVMHETDCLRENNIKK